MPPVSRKTTRRSAPALIAVAARRRLRRLTTTATTAAAAARPRPPPTSRPANGQSLEQVCSRPRRPAGPGRLARGRRVLRRRRTASPSASSPPASEPITDAAGGHLRRARQEPQGPARSAPSRRGSRTSPPSPPSAPRRTADDPDAATGRLRHRHPARQAGPVDLRRPDQERRLLPGSLLPTPSLVGQFDPAPRSGRRPRASTPRPLGEVTDISQIDTRVPPDDMHDDDLADVLGKKPVVLLFATPALCQSRICGPVVDVAEQVKREFGDRRRLHPPGGLQRQRRSARAPGHR